MSAPLPPGGSGSCCAPQCSNSPQYQIPGPAGVNAYTFTTAGFTMPNIGLSVVLSVLNTIWMAAGETVFVEGVGYFKVLSIGSATQVTLLNLGYTGNVPGGSVLGFPIKVVPGGIGGILGTAHTLTTAGFTMPAVSAQVTVAVEDSSWTATGSYVFVTNAGNFQVFGVPDSTHISLTNTGDPGNAAPATVVAGSQTVVASGGRGPAGGAGSSSLSGPGGLSPTTTKGDLLVDNGGQSPNPNVVRLGVGSNGKAVVADSSQASGVNYATITPNAAANDGNIAIYDGTTGTPMALRDSKLLISSDGAIQSTPTGGNARGSKAVDLQVTRAAGTQVASGAHSTIGGGENNTASGADSAVGGGISNRATAANSSVSGGQINAATGTNSSVAGGGQNTASGLDASVSGGFGNTASGSDSSIAAGTSNVASGDNTFIGGGITNVASGQYSTCLGSFNETSGQSSAALGGQGGKLDKFGQVGHASVQFADAGDAQTSELLWHIATTDATANVELFLDGASARALVPLNTAWAFYILLIARTSAGVCTTIECKGGVQNNANTVTLIAASTQAVVVDGSSGALDSTHFAVSADNVNKSLQLAVTGIAATDIRWVARARLVEVSY